LSSYQSFPDSTGASRSGQKLLALGVPPLAGKSFLDIGCNEGFFCGYAAFDGASRVVGIDQDARFIARARERFPHCSFLQQGWDELPDEHFDVILLASALHYADDQPALVARLMQRLAPGGVLVLELGVHPGDDNRWVKVQRGSIDTRLFPTRARLLEVLAPYACRFIGASVRQSGDPVPREVVHVSARRPLALLLISDPGAGKTSLARSVFAPAGVPVVNGDSLLHDIALGRQAASPALLELVRQDHSPRTLDRTLRRLFAAGFGAELVGLWLARAEPGRDVCIDAFVPADFRLAVADWVRDAGFVPVRLEWDALGRRGRAPEDAERAAAAYLASLGGAGDEAASAAAPAAAATPPRPAALPRGIKGHVDGMALAAGRVLSLRGWTVDERGERPAHLLVEVAGRLLPLERLDTVERPDVQRHFGLQHATVGFVAGVRLDADTAAALQPAQVVVRAATLPGQAGTPLVHSRTLSLVRA
jgi:SAM-dependent methyltransferase